jgi:DNA-binding NarL/FixJ family response regulator
MQPASAALIFFVFFLKMFGTAQSTSPTGLDEAAFRAMHTSARLQFIHELHLMRLDSGQFVAQYHPMLAVAQSTGDKRSEWLLRFFYFQKRDLLRVPDTQWKALLTELLALVDQSHDELAKIVTNHYLFFYNYHHREISHRQLYSHVLLELEQIKATGIEQFENLFIDRILFDSGSFIHETGDDDKALEFLLLAEKFARPGEDGLQVHTYILNYLESIYQHKKELDKGILYAKKLLDLSQNTVVKSTKDSLFCSIWRGIATLDLASMLIEAGKNEEGEKIADQGYALVKAPLQARCELIEAEYNMLQVLITIKLNLNKLPEAKSLLNRAGELAALLDRIAQPNYFRYLQLYEANARFYEMEGNFAASVRYKNLATPLRDSLSRRNDARQLEQIKQRLAAEKYDRQIQLIESEKRTQTWLRNAAILILLLVSGLAYGNFLRLRAKRRLAEQDLEAAKNDLANFASGLREKSELAENLRLEIEKIARNDERNEHLEKLSRSTILTDEDWSAFRKLFEQVYPHFIAEQKAQFPDLTPAEIRLLVLEKLGLTAQEMANMLGISKNTIHQTRYRLKKRMNEDL